MALRYEVLRKPLGLNYSPEQLAAERDDTLLAAFSEGRVVACLLLTPVLDGADDAPGKDEKAKTANGEVGIIKMRQVAVAPELQGRGIGKRLVAFAEDWALAHRYRHIILNARDTAIPFYLSLGYTPQGEAFTEVGIPHRRMERALRTKVSVIK